MPGISQPNTTDQGSTLPPAMDGFVHNEPQTDPEPEVGMLLKQHTKTDDPNKKKRFSLIEYVKNSYVELRKVTWPTRTEAMRSTGIVIVFSTAIALFLGGLDFIFNELLSYLISIQ